MSRNRRKLVAHIRNAARVYEEVHRSSLCLETYGFLAQDAGVFRAGLPGGRGYMDPGNWATDLAGGSAFGYTLLSVILLSNLMAILLQSLCARLGIVTGRDLAQACRDHYSKPGFVHALWFLCEIAICACDLAEVIGSAIALNLLFKIPLRLGCVHHGAGCAGGDVSCKTKVFATSKPWSSR